jgi:hypothetical protein
MISKIERFGSVNFPTFSGVRIMMMPFRMEDLGTSPPMLGSWIWAIATLCQMSAVKKGVAYLTIDEAHVEVGRTHRRPGLHVDGIGEDGSCGAWGGGGGSWGANGMLVAASHVGCRAWAQEFAGNAGPNGDCEHLRVELDSTSEVTMLPGEVYWCNPTAVHESLPMVESVGRQFVRLSMPSMAPWHEGYTRNPLGVEPTGPIHPARAEFMAYRT